MKLTVIPKLVMRYLLTLFLALAITFQAYSQQFAGSDANARVGELINSSDYLTLSKELPALREKVAKPLLALADALVAHHEGRFEDSNKAIDRVCEFAPELGSDVIFGMQNIRKWHKKKEDTDMGILNYEETIIQR